MFEEIKCFFSPRWETTHSVPIHNYRVCRGERIGDPTIGLCKYQVNRLGRYRALIILQNRECEVMDYDLAVASFGE